MVAIFVTAVLLLACTAALDARLSLRARLLPLLRRVR
jgi:hypothetical protein